jgi:hypothetical protein
MKRLLRIILLSVLMIFWVTGFAMGMEFTGQRSVMSIGKMAYRTALEGDIDGKSVVDLDGTELKFIVHDTCSKSAYITVEKNNIILFDIPVGFRCNVTEITCAKPAQKLWLIKSDIGVSDSTCIGFWLIGNYAGQYVNYVNVNTIKNALTAGYEFYPKIYRDRIVIESFVRNRGEALRRTGEMDSIVDSITLFWDDKAQWFGIRRD